MKTNNSEIDIFDLLIDVALKWKKIICFMLVLAIIFGFYTFVSNKNKLVDETQIEKAKLSLTDEEIEEVEDSANLIFLYREMYDNQKEYVDNSIYQNLDAYKIPTITLTYYVDNHFQISYPAIQENNNLISIVQTYINSLSRDALFLKFQEKVDDSIDAKYYNELVVANSVGQSDGIFVVNLYYKDNTGLSIMADIVKSYMDSLYDEIFKIYGDYDIKISSETIHYTVNYTMNDRQRDNLDKISYLNSEINKLENSYVDDQLNYLQLLINEDLVEEKSVVKQAAFGAIIGALLVVVFDIIKYLFTGTIKTAKSVIRIVGDDVDTVIIADTQKSRFDRWLYSLKIKNDNPYLISIDELANRVNSFIADNHSSKLAIINSFNNDESMDELKLAITSDVEVIFVEGIYNSINESEKIKSCDCAILIEKVYVSKEKDIMVEKRITDDFGTMVIGVVVDY